MFRIPRFQNALFDSRFGDVVEDENLVRMVVDELDRGRQVALENEDVVTQFELGSIARIPCVEVGAQDIPGSGRTSNLRVARLAVWDLLRSAPKGASSDRRLASSGTQPTTPRMIACFLRELEQPCSLFQGLPGLHRDRAFKAEVMHQRFEISRQKSRGGSLDIPGLIQPYSAALYFHRW